MTLQELKGKRKTLVRRCRGILDKAEDAKRDLTGDEEAETDRLMAEAEGLQLRIKSGEIKKAGEIVDEAPRMQGRSLLPIMTARPIRPFTNRISCATSTILLVTAR